MTRSLISEAGVLSQEEVRDSVEETLSEIDLEEKRVLVIVPDSTRTAPVGLFYRLLTASIGKKARH